MLPESFTVSNAAGWIKSPKGSFEDLVRSSVTHVTAGSYTLEKRDGNPEPRYWSNDTGAGTASINSLGLPNPGILASDTIRELQHMDAACKAHGKKLRISIAGFSNDDFVKLYHTCSTFVPQADIEFNFGCPNVIAAGEHKRIFAFDIALMEQALLSCANAGIRIRKNSIKVSPYSDPMQLRDIAALCNEHKAHVGSVVTCNTFPNAIAFDNDKRAIFGKGYGGLAGTPLKHIMLGQVAQFREYLDPSIGIIAVGGIHTGQDIKDALMAGADGIQIGTAYFDTDDPHIFTQALLEYATLS